MTRDIAQIRMNIHQRDAEIELMVLDEERGLRTIRMSQHWPGILDNRTQFHHLRHLARELALQLTPEDRVAFDLAISALWKGVGEAINKKGKQANDKPKSSAAVDPDRAGRPGA
jgi:hypothetical protein